MNLTTGTSPVHSNGITEAKRQVTLADTSQNRWVRISLKAQDKKLVFQNLLAHVNEDSLREAFEAINGKKAKGVDGISKSEYGKNLMSKLKRLENRIHDGSYRPQPKKEILIPKLNGKMRPIAIGCFEDKLVDWVVGRILSQIYEPLFIRNSFGYRPCRSADGAIRACYSALSSNRRKHVVEIDFSSFFNTIPHRELMKILGKRTSDNRFKGLIGRFMKGELITAAGERLPSEVGTPQGSIMSPVLANIYLNEALDHWFMNHYGSRGSTIVRYADDAVFFFAEEDDARRFLNDLGSRVTKYKLTLNKEKTQIFAMPKGGHQQFNFLGFTFYWGKQSSRTWLKVKTQKEKLIKAIQEFEQWIKSERNEKKLSELWRMARAKIAGHDNYYGYDMNKTKLHHFHNEAKRSLFKWLNRRSQRRSYTWEGFNERIKYFPLWTPVEKRKPKQLGHNPYAR